VPVVGAADTVVEPLAVVVEGIDTAVTLRAVLGTLQAMRLAEVAKVELLALQRVILIFGLRCRTQEGIHELVRVEGMPVRWMRWVYAYPFLSAFLSASMMGSVGTATVLRISYMASPAEDIMINTVIVV
jgi:hypothetical protein